MGFSERTAAAQVCPPGQRPLQLTAAESSLDNVVKAQVFMTDLKDFAGFDEVWKEFFKVPPPRTTVGTNGLLVKDALGRVLINRG